MFRAVALIVVSFTTWSRLRCRESISGIRVQKRHLSVPGPFFVAPKELMHSVMLARKLARAVTDPAQAIKHDADFRQSLGPSQRRPPGRDGLVPCEGHLLSSHSEVVETDSGARR